MYFLLLSFYYPSAPTVISYSIILDGGLPAPQFWTVIFCWWITIFFISTVIYMLPLTSVLFCVSRVVTGNDTGSPSDVLGDYLALYVTIVSILNCSPRSTLTKAFYLVIIEDLIFCKNCHKNMVLQVTPFPRAKETVTGCPFTSKGFL